MTGTIFDIKKFAIHDGPGIRTTVFFTRCPLDCWWCHNPENQPSDCGKGKPEREVEVDEVMLQIEKDRIFYDQSGGGVTFSGGEPLAQIDFLQELLRRCKAQKIATAVDTSGYATADEFERIAGLTDLFLYDLKLIDDPLHKKYTGKSNSAILENLTLLVKRGCLVNVRIPLIPGITDTPANLAAIADFLVTLNRAPKISLLPYNQLGEDKIGRYGLADRLGSRVTQDEETLSGMAQRMAARGFAVKIGG